VVRRAGPARDRRAYRLRPLGRTRPRAPRRHHGARHGLRLGQSLDGRAARPRGGAHSRGLRGRRARSSSDNDRGGTDRGRPSFRRSAMSNKLPIPLLDWIDDHRSELKPPVCNKEMFPGGDFIVQVVGGPNSRTDYHVDEGPELFYQIEGEMLLKTVRDGEFVDVPIREGELYLLPPRVPHSPQ